MWSDCNKNDWLLWRDAGASPGGFSLIVVSRTARS
jgi:hypothetical protein